MYVPFGPWFAARFLSSQPLGLFLSQGVLLSPTAEASWRWLPCADTLMLVNRFTFFTMLPGTLWLAGVVSHWYAPPSCSSLFPCLWLAGVVCHCFHQSTSVLHSHLSCLPAFFSHSPFSFSFPGFSLVFLARFLFLLLPRPLLFFFPVVFLAPLPHSFLSPHFHAHNVVSLADERRLIRELRLNMQRELSHKFSVILNLAEIISFFNCMLCSVH